MSAATSYGLLLKSAGSNASSAVACDEAAGKLDTVDRWVSRIGGLAIMFATGATILTSSPGPDTSVAGSSQPILLVVLPSLLDVAGFFPVSLDFRA